MCWRASLPVDIIQEIRQLHHSMGTAYVRSDDLDQSSAVIRREKIDMSVCSRRYRMFSMQIVVWRNALISFHKTSAGKSVFYYTQRNDKEGED